MKRMIFLPTILWISSALAAPQSTRPSTPRAGSAERKAILDVLRKPVEKAFGQTIVFYDVKIKVKRGWACVFASPRDSQGRPPKNVPADLDITTQALLQKQGKRWVVRFCDSATDAVIVEARRAYPQAPKSIFPSMPGVFPGDGSAEKGDGYNNKD